MTQDNYDSPSYRPPAVDFDHFFEKVVGLEHLFHERFSTVAAIILKEHGPEEIYRFRDRFMVPLLLYVLELGEHLKKLTEVHLNDELVSVAHTLEEALVIATGLQDTGNLQALTLKAQLQQQKMTDEFEGQYRSLIVELAIFLEALEVHLAKFKNIDSVRGEIRQNAAVAYHERWSPYALRSQLIWMKQLLDPSYWYGVQSPNATFLPKEAVADLAPLMQIVFQTGAGERYPVTEFGGRLFLPDIRSLTPMEVSELWNYLAEFYADTDNKSWSLNVFVFDRLAQQISYLGEEEQQQQKCHISYCSGPGHFVGQVKAVHPEVKVLAIDIAPKMVELSRIAGADESYVLDLNNDDLPENLHEVADSIEISFAEQWLVDTAFSNAWKALKPGGVLVYNVYRQTDTWQEDQTKRLVKAGFLLENCTCFSETYKDEAAVGKLSGGGAVRDIGFVRAVK